MAATLLHPPDASLIDAAMAEFAWSPEAAAQRLQVASDPGFQHVEADVPVGGLTVVTLEGLFPDDGRTYHWRVGDEGRWSEAGTFRTVDADAAFDWTEAQRLERREARLVELRELQASAHVHAEAAAAWRVAHTDRTEAITFATLIVVTFLAVVVMVFHAVT